VLTPPTTEWQDQLCNRLAANRAVPSRPDSTSLNSPGTETSDHSAQRRRLDSDFLGFSSEKPDWNNMYTLDNSSSDDKGSNDGAAAFGQLSLDEHQEAILRFRFQVPTT
jgi:hypothetical protein